MNFDELETAIRALPAPPIGGGGVNLCGFPSGDRLGNYLFLSAK
jgi:hypothetical protein